MAKTIIGDHLLKKALLGKTLLSECGNIILGKITKVYADTYWEDNIQIYSSCVRIFVNNEENEKKSYVYDSEFGKIKILEEDP